MRVALLIIGFALASRVNAVQGPKLPSLDPGACPFECCRYGEWTAAVNQQAYRRPRAGADRAFLVRRGEKVQAETGVVITRKPGIVIVRKRTTFNGLTVPTGAKLFVLHSLGEGSYLFWYKGSTHRGGLYAETVHTGNAQYPWDVLSVPKGEWWVKVKNQRGATGWLLNPHEFLGMDACGD